MKAEGEKFMNVFRQTVPMAAGFFKAHRFDGTGSFDSAPRRLRPPRRSAQDDLKSGHVVARSA